MRNLCLILSVSFLALLSGCASVVRGTPGLQGRSQERSSLARTAISSSAKTAYEPTFAMSGLSGSDLVLPTSLMFGPDGRLYVAQSDGRLVAYTIERLARNRYTVVLEEPINLIYEIPNHNDDGTFHAGVGRQVTGLEVAGSATHPVLYVTSSDYRVGGGEAKIDYGLDTNSGVISMLTCVGGVTQKGGCLGWEKVDLVRGLPRSEQNHATNGIVLSAAENRLYVAQGGFTDTGAPSPTLGFTGETALSAAILQVDLNLILELPTRIDSYGQAYKYNLPTLNSLKQSDGRHQYDDPWGGADGLNQAVLRPQEPVQLYATGFRNPFDLLVTEAGHMYTVDNGSNFDWGGYPEYEESYDCTNNYHPDQPGSIVAGPNPGEYPPSVRLLDGENGTVASDGKPDAAALNIAELHLLSEGYYAGHANPTRGNPAGAGIYLHDQATGEAVWLTAGDPQLPAGWPPVLPEMGNPIECDFQGPGTDGRFVANLGPSTNGLTEYTASNFRGEMRGVLLGASFTNHIFQIVPNETGDGTRNCPANRLEPCIDPFAEGFGAVPLDVVAVGDEGLFPGTVWVVNHLSGVINIFEPADYRGDRPLELPVGRERLSDRPAEMPERSLGEVVACINVGGEAFIGADGREFVADEAVKDWIRGGELAETVAEIDKTEDDRLYHTERWGDMSYFIPLPAPNEYIVELYFAEVVYGVYTEEAVGSRLFNVKLDHAPVLTGYDIAAEAGGAKAAVVERFYTTSYDAMMMIEFTNGGVDNPKVSAICVWETAESD